MIKKLVKHGDMMAIVIEKPILDLLNINEDTPLDITTDGTSLIISPPNTNSTKKLLQNALFKTNSHVTKVLREFGAD